MPNPDTLCPDHPPPAQPDHLRPPSRRSSGQPSHHQPPNQPPPTKSATTTNRPKSATTTGPKNQTATTSPAMEPPSPGHLRPPLPPEVSPPEIHTKPSHKTMSSPSASLVNSVEDVPSPEMSDDERVYGGDVPSPEMSDDDHEDDGILEDFAEIGSLSPLHKVENIQFRVQMNAALKAMNEEQLEIRMVDAILGEEGRKMVALAKNAIEKNGQDGTSGKPSSAGIHTPAAPPASLPAATPFSGEAPAKGSLIGPNSDDSTLSHPLSPHHSINSINQSINQSIKTAHHPTKPQNNFPSSYLNLNLDFPPLQASNQTDGAHAPHTHPNLPKPTAHIPNPEKDHQTHGQPKLHWKALLQSHPRMALSFVPPPRDESGFLKLSPGTSVEGESLWKTTLVGYSVDRRVPFKLLQQRVMGLWSSFGLISTRMNKEGFFFFKFISVEGLQLVLNKGPWIIMGQQIHLKPWRRDFEFRKEEFKSIPNWIKLFGIPTTYWSKSGLSAIASYIGTPLYADEITSQASLLDYARICVEMEVGSKFPLSFTVQTEFDEVFEVRVEYSWRPRQCALCNVFGHSTISCPKKLEKSKIQPKPNLIYRPKIKPDDTTNIRQGPGPTMPSNPQFDNSLVMSSDVGAAPLRLANKFGPLVLGNRDEVEDGPAVFEAPLAVGGEERSCGIVAGGDEVRPTEEMGAVTLSSPSTSGSGVVGGGGDVRPTPLAEKGKTAMDSGSPSPILWGHKVVLVDELERRHKKNQKKSVQRKKKRQSMLAEKLNLDLVECTGMAHGLTLEGRVIGGSPSPPQP